jgi:hypothetical protein
MSVSRILELLAQIDKANAEHSPSRRADYADALVDELRDIFPDDRLSEIAQAERDGRLVVLPCKVGAEVFATVDCVDVIKDCDDDYDGIGDITCPFEDHCIFEECDDSNQILAETHVSGWWCDDSGTWQVFLDHINAYLRVDDFGKTVFLTRAEAEAALKEAQHE